ncbi:hypothetical protein [Jannaschia pohangensis]|uniref:Uncharacterized protein n=1 Tax=Jannaschia pohangensis TaxID=390807 RepID=A0A1I3I8H6_9RHOB|nr:hypothetical protein [Jannaschia pohangensis]SFI44160.1 hypothetical protein SAMN04488095_0855 [Jannaschia pohangensis]
MSDFFLPLLAETEIPLHPYAGTPTAFGPTPSPEATAPLDRPISFVRAFAPIQWSLLLAGRFAMRSLDDRRRGDTDKSASDAVVILFRDFVLTLAQDAAHGTPAPPFWEPELRRSDLVTSNAYGNMKALEFSEGDMRDALAPWKIID